MEIATWTDLCAVHSALSGLVGTVANQYIGPYKISITTWTEQTNILVPITIFHHECNLYPTNRSLNLKSRGSVCVT